jgi:multiple sugar transport system ATP-binding protein
MSNAISFTQVDKVFPPMVHALRGLNLEIGENEFMVVVGPSGCGKSTLLRLIAGLEEPTAGSIHLHGKNASKLAPQERDLGLVFQNYALFPHLTAFDNMAYGLKARHEPEQEISQKVDTVAQKLNITDFLKRKPHQLSGGQRQRVALGRLLARDPRIHLFDEPLGNLDPQFRTSMRTELARLHREAPRTSVYVTHDQAEAMCLGQRICVLREGKILQVGTPEDIYDSPSHRFTAEFFGSPGACSLHGEIKKMNDDSLSFISKYITLPLTERDLPIGSITLCIRPENWSISDPENAPIKGVIKRVENLGDHRLIEVKTGEINISVKTSLKDICERESIGILPQLERAHWFERYTGKRLKTT